MDWVKDFYVPVAVNMVGVFVGVLLALWTDRRRQEFADARDAKRTATDFADLREVVLSSVVPSLTATFQQLARRYFDLDPLYVSANLPIGIRLAVDNPQEVGGDLLGVAVVEAPGQYVHPNSLATKERAPQRRLRNPDAC